jgi:hypothetical protein
MTMPHAPPAIASLSVLKQKWETLARLASWWNHRGEVQTTKFLLKLRNHLHLLIGFEVQITNFLPLGFEAQTKKSSWWFCGSNHQTAATNFKAQTGKPADLGFEAQPRNPRSSSPCAQCKLHTVSLNLPIIWPQSTRPVLDHPRSSAPGLLLLPWSSSLLTISHVSPTHHETSKYDSPHEQIETEPPKHLEFEFKQWHIIDSSQSNQGTDHFLSQSPPWRVHW